MIKQSAIRSQRYKGFKVKHFLQICALLALCIWLLSQFKDTYGKKGIGVVQNVMNEHGAIKLGRKDLDPHQVQGSLAENNETGEGEAEEESKAEESEDDRRGNREKADGEESEEVEVLEDLIDEEDTEV